MTKSKTRSKARKTGSKTRKTGSRATKKSRARKTGGQPRIFKRVIPDKLIQMITEANNKENPDQQRKKEEEEKQKRLEKEQRKKDEEQRKKDEEQEKIKLAEKHHADKQANIRNAMYNNNYYKRDRVSDIDDQILAKERVERLAMNRNHSSQQTGNNKYTAPYDSDDDDDGYYDR